METFRGAYNATIDEKGRLKLPTRLKAQLESSHGLHVFITSLRPSELRIYPFAVWVEKERRFLERSPWDPLVQDFLERANYGQEDEVDNQGRVLVPAHLREILGFTGEVLVSGRGDYFAVVPRERVRTKLMTDFTSEQWAALAALEKE